MAQNDLVTRLLLNSTQFDKNLVKSAQQVKNFQITANNIGKGVSTSFSSMMGAATKLAGAFGLAMGGLEAFNKLIGSTQTLTDGFNRNMSAAKSSIDSFFTSIANGDFSNLLDGLSDTIRLAKDAYDAVDALGTFTITSDAEISGIQAKIEKAKYEIKAGINVEANDRLIKDLEGQLLNLAKTKGKKALTAYYTELRKNLSEGGFNGRVTNNSLNQIFGSSQSYENYSTWYKNQNKKIDDLNNQYWNAHNVAKQKEIQKQIDDIKNNPTYRLMRAAAEMSDEKLKEAYSYQIAANQANTEFYRQMQANLKVHNKANQYHKSNTSEIHKQTQELKEQYDIANSLSKLSSITIGGSIKLGDNDINTITSAIKELPTELQQELGTIFDNYFDKQAALQNQLTDGIISQDEYAKETTLLLTHLYGSFNAFSSSKRLAMLNKEGIDNSKVLTVIGEIRKFLASGVNLNNQLANNATKFDAAKAIFDKGKEDFLNTKMAFKSDNANNFNGQDLRQRLATVNAYKKQISELYDTLIQLSQSGDLKGFDKDIEALIESVGTFGDTLEDLSSKWSLNLLHIGEFIKKMNTVSTVANEVGQMFSNVGSSLQSIGDAEDNAAAKTTGFVLQQMGAIAQLVAQYGTLMVAAESAAIAKGVESSSSLPFPYNLVAIGATVATIIGAIASGVSFAKQQRFADGGIVGGSSYVGDLQTVRVNSGEMILNRKQQANLFGLISNGYGIQSTQSNNQVEFVIRGKELHGVLNNYNNKRNKLI